MTSTVHECDKDSKSFQNNEIKINNSNQIDIIMVEKKTVITCDCQCEEVGCYQLLRLCERVLHLQKQIYCVCQCWLKVIQPTCVIYLTL